MEYNLDYKDFNKKLARAFVKDFNIPMYVIDSGHFFHMLYEFECEHEWKFLAHTLNSLAGNFDEQVECFFEARNRIKDSIIYDVTSTDAYKAYNTMDMQKYACSFNTMPDTGKHNYISIDLCSANLQAMHYVNPDITFGCTTWSEFLYKLNGHNKMSDYLAASKNFRQVVFGMMNPKRAIIVEKYIMSKIHDLVFDKFGFELLTVNNDELIYSTVLDFEEVNNNRILDNIKDLIKTELGFDVHVKCYKKTNLRLRNRTNNDLTQMFSRLDYSDGTMKLKAVPGYLYCIVKRLIKNDYYNNLHKYFIMDNMTCIIHDDFDLCDENGNKINTL